jgi:hypothetical protein
MFSLRYTLGKLIFLQVFAGVADTGSKLLSVLLFPVIIIAGAFVTGV